jgi:hypothetical protein
MKNIKVPLLNPFYYFPYLTNQKFMHNKYLRKLGEVHRTGHMEHPFTTLHAESKAPSSHKSAWKSFSLSAAPGRDNRGPVFASFSACTKL